MIEMSLTNGNRDTKPVPKRLQPKRGEAADWGGVENEAIVSAISALGSIGGALRFGYSRDGGAYALGIYGMEKQPYTEYLRPGDDVPAFLYQLADSARHAGPLEK
jgi:hypothetical protein